MLVKSVSAVMGEGRRGAIEGRVEDRGGWNDHSDVMEMIRVWERNMGDRVRRAKSRAKWGY